MLTDYQFNKYLYAHLEIEELKEQYEKQRQEAYDDISPTMTLFDSEAGKVVSGSVSVEEHAIYLMELYERYNKRLKKYNKRIELLNEAVELLYDDERAEFEVWKQNPIGNYPKVLGTLKECLEFVLEGVAISQHVENEMSVEVWDAHVENMSDEELFSDYWDIEDTFDKEILKMRPLMRKCGRKSKVELEHQVS